MSEAKVKLEDAACQVLIKYKLTEVEATVRKIVCDGKLCFVESRLRQVSCTTLLIFT